MAFASFIGDVGFGEDEIFIKYFFIYMIVFMRRTKAWYWIRFVEFGAKNYSHMT